MTFTVFSLIYTVKRRQRLLMGVASDSGNHVSEPDAMRLPIWLGVPARGLRDWRRENRALKRASILRPIASHVPPRISSEIAS
jgi:hypothetical protein